MAARIALAFATAILALLALGALLDGEGADLLYLLPAAAVAGFLLLRNLRDASVTRQGGHFAMVTFALEPGEGVARRGTFAHVRTRVHDTAWNVALDRPPQRADFDLYGTTQRGWVWLDPSGLPEKLRVDYGTTWKSWPVLDAAIEAQGQGHGT